MPFISRVGRPGLLGMAARTAVVSGTATAVSGAVARRQQQRAAEHGASAPAPAPATGPGDDLLDKLQQLAAMAQQGLLTPEEFARAKQQLLGG